MTQQTLETIAELPAFVQLAAEIGVREVYLQRLVFFANDAIGLARPDQTLYEQMTRDELDYLEAAAALARSYGITFAASGAVSEPGMSLKRHDDGSPWTLCRRPWTVMYFTANGRALPSCIAPFSHITRLVMPPSKRCKRFGTARRTDHSAKRFSRTSRLPHVQIVACAEAYE